MTAHELHQQILATHPRHGEGPWQHAAFLAAMHESKSYKDLGCDTWEEYLGQPEIAHGRSTAFDYIKASQAAQALEISGEEWNGADISKVAVVATRIKKAVKAGQHPDAYEWWHKAKTLSKSDLLDLIRGDDDDEPTESEEEQAAALQQSLRTQLVGNMISDVSFDGTTLSVTVSVLVPEPTESTVTVVAKRGALKFGTTHRSLAPAAVAANPDLPPAFVEDLLESKAQADAGLLEPLDQGEER